MLADGERGALLGPDGSPVRLRVPGWDAPAVLSELIGGAGAFQVAPEDPWHVPSGRYREGSLIRTTRWTLAPGVIECRDALAAPADQHRAVVLRRVRTGRAVCAAARLRRLRQRPAAAAAPHRPYRLGGLPRRTPDAADRGHRRRSLRAPGPGQEPAGAQAAAGGAGSPAHARRRR
ncbi:trehalase-like domain-containing protein [Streptomyces sp. NPDC015661]|uniref:trehalase-like domain-containing protein n=1 Tax=Streptomyces sp. NPDC015661 TaxID=3364961 RepID=UPI0036F995B7